MDKHFGSALSSCPLPKSQSSFPEECSYDILGKLKIKSLPNSLVTRYNEHLILDDPFQNGLDDVHHSVPISTNVQAHFSCKKPWNMDIVTIFEMIWMNEAFILSKLKLNRSTYFELSNHLSTFTNNL